MIYECNGRLVFRFDAEELWVEPWGENALRVRASKCAPMPEEDRALQRPDGTNPPAGREPEIVINREGGSITNGELTAQITAAGKLRMVRSDGTVLLEEFWRNRRDVTDPSCSALEVEAREFTPLRGGDYHLTLRLESLDEQEKIYGMGQYQQNCMDMKGCVLELAQRNSQASVPFYISSLGYGMLWNNPAVGRAVFGKNVMSFEAYSTKLLDYWFTAGDTPARILQAYAAVTGTVPMMPEYGLGFWQCKLRYQTQEELLEVAREYRRRNLPLDVIVVDFFHWPRQGEWKFDPVFWPDPEGMVKELDSMGIRLMVSIWPTVDRQSGNFEEMLEKGYLIRTERGYRCGLDFQGATIHFDATNPEACRYVWQKVKQNYYDKGIRIFWLDEAEPEYSLYEFDNYRYHMGTDLEIGNIYPLCYAKAFYDGMRSEGQEQVVNLLRCAWAGSARYGALVWSGDIASSFESMRSQLAAGLNMGMAGIPWWTTDIGGFHGGDPDDPQFRELFARWFEWAAYCPVMRLHGDREPRQPQLGEGGGSSCRSGAANEVWSYGEEIYEICRKYLRIREEMRDYIRALMREAHEKGSPLMRTLFYEFPDDMTAWTVEDAYMFGDRFLVAPVLRAGERKRKVYLPKGADWKYCIGDEVIPGSTWLTVPAPLDTLPVFERIIM